MSDPNKPWTLYFRLRKTITVPEGTEIKLGMIANVVSQPDHDELVKNFVIIPSKHTYGEKILIDLMDIIRLLQQAYPQVNVECFGESQTLVFFRAHERKPRLLFSAIVWLLLFIGSGLAIMNFHTDVSMMEVHQKLYWYITGEQLEHPLMLQIPYSFGLGIGMILFFNRIFKTRLNKEPDPLELEMYNYRNNIVEYSIKEELGDGRKENAD